MANVALGHTETAGVYSKGADQFRVGTSPQERVQGREDGLVVLNVTAVEGLTAQLSGNVDNSATRIVLGYNFGGFGLSAGIDNADAGVGEDAVQIKATASLGDIAIALSHADQDSGDWTNLNASYMGLGVAVEDQNGEQAVYGSYGIANAGGLEGLTVTVGAGSADSADSKYGVRLDYAF